MAYDDDKATLLRERDLLLWLHAEAVHKLALPCGSCHPCENWVYEDWRRTGKQPPYPHQWEEAKQKLWALDEALERSEASRRDWAAEADRLDTALDVIAAHCEELSAKADAKIGEIAGADLAWSAWGRAAQWLRHARNQRRCSLPLCAVHPEADR